MKLLNLAKEIVEGCAKIQTAGKVFYNPVQEFNRDISILVLRVFSKYFIEEKKTLRRIKEPTDFGSAQYATDLPEKGTKYENGIKVLEALSATGLRSIRYAKEIPGIQQIIANDISEKAVEDIRRNVENNQVSDIVIPHHDDATMLMYKHRRDERFDVIDLDPYGCPSIFLDSALQSVTDGGLILVTATDMAILAGNSPETCHTKYGSVSLKIKCCHEMAVRILLQCIESHANRYSRYIVPLLSISADFYIRVFVRVYTSAHKCKFTMSKLSNVFHCTGCDSFTLQPLGILKKNDKPNNVKFGLPAVPVVPPKCEHCGGTQHMGGPIWSAPIHSSDFVGKLLENISNDLETFRRIEGVLNVINEELHDCPLYYTIERLSGTLHVETMPMLTMRSAILNAGFRVSYSHMCKTGIKTDAPGKVIWDIMRCWIKSHPVNETRLTGETPVAKILSVQPEKEYNFQAHPLANPDSRKSGLLRFQANPQPFWGPGTRAQAMVGEERMSKSKRNQGKRKRENSEEKEGSGTSEN
ncbi:probable tRNA (guanine(26)-N(2))-dimethyltransferase isoform X2 [Coccinella septempunctata]|uniref:probable tRNA (guanine(26)-N(2))-dimethyltransferase isoform X2 n=1 Tax=Coccinella septempunctata TaxID=41139 RepID=UPI001D075138|nr:probable tRNA (guanine(26)-N(2))-dimethyltransferase isoform X2 [Coccinella septempunctata]